MGVSARALNVAIFNSLSTSKTVQAPTRRNELALSVRPHDRVDGRSRADVVTRPLIARRLAEQFGCTFFQTAKAQADIVGYIRRAQLLASFCGEQFVEPK